MNTRNWLAAGLAATTIAFAGCEKKEPSTTPPTTPSSTKTTGQEIKDAAKSAADAAKDTASKAADKAKETYDAAKDKLSQPWAKTTETMQGYIDDVNKTTNVMAGIKDGPSATTALPKLKDLAASVTAKAGALTALTPDDQTKVRSEFKDQLSAAVKGLRAEIDRVTKDPATNALVGDVARNMKLFE